MDGWFYLHTNGDLIYKRDLDGTQADLAESPFVRSVWPMDARNRLTAWDMLVESSALGADATRIAELASKWGCHDTDAVEYAKRAGVILTRDGSQWCATRRDFVDLQTSPAGFGASCLDAMGALCRDLGFSGRRMWSPTFRDLVQAEAA